MLWKLDCFFLLHPPQVTAPVEEKDSEENGTEGRVSEKRKRKDPNPEEEEKVVVETNEGIPLDETTDAIFTDDDYAFAEILGLSEPIELSAIKSTYRKTIAQYHPDRVMAMGSEIKEVAEKKAKEINEAYEHFRKKFDLNWFHSCKKFDFRVGLLRTWWKKPKLILYYAFKLWLTNQPNTNFKPKPNRFSI